MKSRIQFGGGAVIAVLLTVTATIGIFINKNRSALGDPIRNSKTTRAAFRFSGSGEEMSRFSGMIDDNNQPLMRPGIAMWARFDIPQGNRVNPRVELQVLDPSGEPFPFTISWFRGVAYVFLPQGYASVPQKLTVIARQGSEVIGQADLPSPPAPKSPPKPALSPLWSGVKLTRCSTSGQDGKNVSLQVSANLPSTDTLTVRSRGSSAAAVEAYDGIIFGVHARGQKEPTIIDLNVNYPKTTRWLYLDLEERRVESLKRQPLLITKLARILQGHVVRKEVVAVPLDAPPVDPNPRAIHAPSGLMGPASLGTAFLSGQSGRREKKRPAPMIGVAGPGHR